MRYSEGSWSTPDPGKLTIYSAFSDGTTRTSYEFAYTAAHEFGHLAGVGDAYHDSDQPNRRKKRYDEME